MARRTLLLTLCLLLFLFCMPLNGLAVIGCVVEVEDDDAVTLFATNTGDLGWIVSRFSSARDFKTTQTRFVFASAPEATKTRAVLNKKGESLTLYRFDSAKEMQKCAAMIKGNSLVYGGKTVYVDTLFPATYYAGGKTIALYCGADTAVDKKLKETFEVAGGYGGYFDKRDEAALPAEAEGLDMLIVSPPQERPAPKTLKELRKRADSVYVAKVKKVPVWGKGTQIDGMYELEVVKNVRGIARAVVQLRDWPGVMQEGREYVLYLKHEENELGGTKVIYADTKNHSTFEIDDRGYVLPIREYGMKAPAKLEKFLKGI